MKLRRHATATIDLFVYLISGKGYNITIDFLGTRIEHVKTVYMAFFSPKWPNISVILSPCFSLL